MFSINTLGIFPTKKYLLIPFANKKRSLFIFWFFFIPFIHQKILLCHLCHFVDPKKLNSDRTKQFSKYSNFQIPQEIWSKRKMMITHYISHKAQEGVRGIHEPTSSIGSCIVWKLFNLSLEKLEFKKGEISEKKGWENFLKKRRNFDFWNLINIFIILQFNFF